MKGKIASHLAAALLLASAAWSATPAAPAPEAIVPVPESITAQGVPPIPARGVEDLLPYENIRTASFADWHPKERRLLIRTRFAESPQLHEVAAPMGARAQLTFYRDPITAGTYRPGDLDQLVYSLNEGGAENYQLFLLDRRSGRARRFTDGVHRYVSPLWSHDGKLLAYASNARNGRDMDVYVADPAVAGSERRVAEVQGSWTPIDWSADDRRLLLFEDISANEAYLHWVDAAGGAVHAITPRNAGKDAPTVAYQGGKWSSDGRSVYTLSDRDSEFLRLVRLDLATGATTVLSGDVPWDVEAFDLTSDGKLLAFFTNEDGVSKLHLLNATTGASLPAPELPAGVAGDLTFRPGSHEAGFDLSWARSPSDVYSYDADSRHLERWTASESGGLNPQS
ncbi:MAG TPA: S9 family peptidase, partial [Thermoanaerobaculia bacterium]|nr:S9 family peptidase [Thermoanaerobaculia bacterium]